MEGIDDILATVDRDNTSLPEATALDHQQLTRFWVAERAVPELLPWQAPLMDRMMARVQKQIMKIEDLSFSASDPTYLQQNRNTSNPTLNLQLSILQSDLSRTQYMIRSILRQRLSKLTKYSIYYLRLSQDQDGSGQSQSQSQSQTQPLSRPWQQDRSLLSDQELQFLRAHQSLLTMHYNTSFLSDFPANLRRLDDNAGGTTMITAPENKEVVCVRCLGEDVGILIPSDDGVGGGGDAMMGVESYGNSMNKGEVWVVRWEGVKEAWGRGEIEVL